MKILIKPIVTEKAQSQQERYRRYAFVVDRRADKKEIKKEVETLYNVKVENVRTMIYPPTRVARNTKKGIIRGKKSSYKKAYVTLTEGGEIDFYENI